MVSAPTATADAPGSPPTATATLEHYLDRINQRDSLIQGWAHLDTELARKQARSRDEEPPRSALHGIPIGVKDIIDTGDQPTAYGSELWAGHRPERDAHVVARLREAGAIILGKTATTEFATYRPCATRNPHNPDHTPGGSSSGSAATVADGQVPVALGTQTAGSVLRPGSFCGVFTLKPTYGRWPFDGILPVALSFDTVGGFARHPVWLGVLDQVLAQRHTVETLPATDRLRVGVLRSPWNDRATPSAVAALGRFVAGVSALGASHVDIEVPDELADLDDAHTLIMAVEAATALSGRLDHDGRTPISDQLAEFLSVGRSTTSNDIQRARGVVQASVRFAAAAFRGVDVLVTLAATGEAPEGLASTGDPVFNKLASVTGLPAIGLPVGTGVAQLPLGVQVIGPPHTDHALVRVATHLTDRAGLTARCPLPEEQR